ncbi:hypothetical protein GCM10027075_57580 [Streptomyces heilongjiangensis]
MSVNARSVACRHEAEGRCRPLPKILTIPACQLRFPPAVSVEWAGRRPRFTLSLASNHGRKESRSLPMGYPTTGKVRPSRATTLASDSTTSD